MKFHENYEHLNEHEPIIYILLYNVVGHSCYAVHYEFCITKKCHGKKKKNLIFNLWKSLDIFFPLSIIYFK